MTSRAAENLRTLSKCTGSSSKSKGSPHLKGAQGLVVFWSSWVSSNNETENYNSQEELSLWCKQNWNWLNELASLIANIWGNSTKVRGHNKCGSACCQKFHNCAASKCLKPSNPPPHVICSKHRSTESLVADVGWWEDNRIKGNTHVWPHCVVTGLSKISRQTGQINSDTSLLPSETFFLCCAALNPPSIAISFLHWVSLPLTVLWRRHRLRLPFFNAQGAELSLTVKNKKNKKQTV